MLFNSNLGHMLVMISPAKKLDFETNASVATYSQPLFLKKTQKLIKTLKDSPAEDIKKMMKLSDSLTELNMKRYQEFKTPFTPKNAKQAIFAFKGDTYVGFDVETLGEKHFSYAQEKLRILSGLYGMLSPFDLIQPYRLEMGVKFSCESHPNLYSFWKDDLEKEVLKKIQSEKYIVNLASQEYFQAVGQMKLPVPVITPIFKEKKGDNLKIVSFFAKKARGMMARYIIENQIDNPEDLKKFDAEGYCYAPKLGTKFDFVFTRSL